LVQTPQVFRNSLIQEAYKQDFSPLFTDDASVVESIGEKIFLVEGNRENIKLTTPMDLLLAEALFNNEIPKI
jgi:2-C-methyl-D-erythritol 4-phosphate cytidylyltransferase